jgi:choline dehydrogenase
MVPTKINNWAYKTVAQPGLNGRRGYQPRGKTLGGSSSINAMLYVRGHRWDYDHWAQLGNAGWSYDEVLPYFKKSENNETYQDAYHGQGGPLNVAELRQPSQLNPLFLQAAAQCGVPTVGDYNGAEQFGAFQYQVTHQNGERCSAAKGYLTPNLSRPNLTVITHALTRKILFSGTRAVGVHVRVKGQDFRFHARIETLLCAGAFGSPQLLQLSGIGPGQLLQANGIHQLVDLPGVGENLQDHIDYIYSYYTHQPTDTLGYTLRGVAHVLRGIVQWRRSRQGLMTSSLAEAGAFLRSHPGIDAPDLQLILVRHRRRPRPQTPPRPRLQLPRHPVPPQKPRHRTHCIERPRTRPPHRPPVLKRTRRRRPAHGGCRHPTQHTRGRRHERRAWQARLPPGPKQPPGARARHTQPL